ncbi:MAG: hypothetical protein PHN54_02740 [Bacilli bacterium]|nr:hypothetical protein [Bacilli bacterium]
MIKFLNKYKLTIIMIVFISISVVLFLSFKSFIYPEDSKSVYGDRLEGIEDVVITDLKKEELKAFIDESNTVIDSKFETHGKIINIIINLNSKGTEEKAKDLFNDILEKFSEQELEYYDFQYFVNNEELKYLLIGYKNKISEIPVYTISREVEQNEED